MSGGGSSAPTSQTITQSNIPDWLQPQVESLLGGATQQIFNTTPMVDASGNPVLGANGQQLQNVGSVKPYQAYGGTYDANGNLTNPQQAAQAAVAGFSPLQNQVQNNVAGMQMPGQFLNASYMAGNAGQYAMDTAPQAMGYGQQGAGYGGNATGLAGSAQGYGQQGAQAGMGYGQQATDPNAVQQYMNPYLQASLAPQEALLAQQQGQQQATNQAQATQAGAFGGSRMGVQNALQNQANQLAMSNLVGQGYNTAFNTANQNMQTAANLGMQGAQTGISGLNAANQAYQTGIQGAGMGLQGVAGAQNAYNLGNTAASNLANIGNQQLAGQQSIYNMQNTVGAQQQQQQQNIINQAISNYSNAQQYPMQQYNAYNALLRGYAVPGQTATSYQAAPSATSMMTGLGTAGIGAAQLAKGAKGGKISGDGIDKLAINHALKRKAKA